MALGELARGGGEPLDPGGDQAGDEEPDQAGDEDRDDQRGEALAGERLQGGLDLLRALGDRQQDADGAPVADELDRDHRPVLGQVGVDDRARRRARF